MVVFREFGGRESGPLGYKLPCELDVANGKCGSEKIGAAELFNVETYYNQPQ